MKVLLRLQNGLVRAAIGVALVLVVAGAIELTTRSGVSGQTYSYPTTFTPPSFGLAGDAGSAVNAGAGATAGALNLPCEQITFNASDNAGRPVYVTPLVSITGACSAKITFSGPNGTLINVCYLMFCKQYTIVSGGQVVVTVGQGGILS